MAPYLGPEYDAAVRLKKIEDRLARLESNPLGQAFSVTQSDGSIGLQIGPDQTTGATRTIWYQGTTSSRDPNTAQHPMLMYIGELMANGQFVDSGLIFYRPTGTESGVIGNRGIQVLDTKGNQVLATDEYGSSPSGEGLSSPWIELGQPTSTHFSHWPYTNSTTSAMIAEKFFQAQHAKVYWNASVAGDSGVSGTVQMTITVNGQSVSSASYTYSGTQVNISEDLILPQPFFGRQATLQINGQVTGGTGNLYCATWQLTGRQS